MQFPRYGQHYSSRGARYLNNSLSPSVGLWQASYAACGRLLEARGSALDLTDAFQSFLTSSPVIAPGFNTLKTCLEMLVVKVAVSLSEKRLYIP